MFYINTEVLFLIQGKVISNTRLYTKKNGFIYKNILYKTYWYNNSSDNCFVSKCLHLSENVLYGRYFYFSVVELLALTYLSSITSKSLFRIKL